MDSLLVYGPDLVGYYLGGDHPLKPERFALAVELMEAYGLVPSGTANGVPRDQDDAPLRVRPPVQATRRQLELVHCEDYVALVEEAEADPDRIDWPLAGLGGLDTPVFPSIHTASALVAGAAIVAGDAVLSGECLRSFSVAGGLHHAHRDYAAGFCVYNDCAIAIAHALVEHPDLRILYVDVDAHHGDGVQEAFWDEPRVLTISVHETGMALFPGTGFARERGGMRAPGSAANIAMPPGATDACFRLAFEEAVAPLARSFGPDIVFAQCGADTHHSDPLTSLGLTLAGYRWLVRSVVGLADELSGGRLVAFGGGGYAWENVVPRAWTLLAADIAGVELPEELPERWRERARAASDVQPPAKLADDCFQVGPATEGRLLAETRAAVSALLAE